MKIYFYKVSPCGAALTRILRAVANEDLPAREKTIAGRYMRIEDLVFPKSQECRIDFVRARMIGLPGRMSPGVAVSDLVIHSDEDIGARAAAVLIDDTIAIQRNMSARESTILNYVNTWADCLEEPCVGFLPEVSGNAIDALSHRRCRRITFEVNCSDHMSQESFLQQNIADALQLRSTMGHRRIEVTVKAPQRRFFERSEARDLVRSLHGIESVEKLIADVEGPDGNMAPLNFRANDSRIHVFAEVPDSDLTLTEGRQFTFRSRAGAISKVVYSFLEGK